MKANRASLTKRERDAMYERQGGMCFCPCRQPLGSRFIAEHWTPVALGNASKPDCLLRETCAKSKTVRDVKAIAKVRRITGRTRSQWNGDRKSKPIKSAGFKGWRKMDGTVVFK